MQSLSFKTSKVTAAEKGSALSPLPKETGLTGRVGADMEGSEVARTLSDRTRALVSLARETELTE